VFQTFDDATEAGFEHSDCVTLGLSSGSPLCSTSKSGMRRMGSDLWTT
jgi:hypothetical protein